jgi:thioredoxin 1
MHLPSFWKWLALVAVGLILSAGTLVVCKTPPGCFLNPQPRKETRVLTSPPGEKYMSVTHQKRHVQHADDATFQETVLKSDVPVLVDFYADWCGPCQSLAPVLEQLAAETASAKIVKVNVDNSPSLAAEYGIDSIPSLKVFRNGMVTGEIVGLASKKELLALLSR